MKNITLSREARERLARQVAETTGLPVACGDVQVGARG